MREHRQLPLAHAVDVGPRARVAFDRALRVLRSRRFGHRDAVFLYGRLETREDIARLLGRIAHDLGDPLTQCDAPLLSKGARGVFAGEVARPILGPLTRQGANELALLLEVIAAIRSEGRERVCQYV